MLRNGEVPHVTQFAKAIFLPGDASTAHSHGDMVEVFLVDKGSLTVKVDGKRTILGPGGMVAIEANEVHELINEGEEPLEIICFGVEISPAEGLGKGMSGGSQVPVS